MYYKSLNDVDAFDAVPFETGDRAQDLHLAPDFDLAFAAQPTTAYRSIFKRALDLTLVGLTAPIVALVVVFLAILVALEGGSPFYYQKRVGRGGRMFRMWKLRTMVPDADKKLEEYISSNPDARREWDVNQKLAHDPRITRVGRLLRKTSLDELPQLWNVLVGNMSLVGPRPMMPSQQVLYPGVAYYRLLPGITGPWQVSKRNQSSFADRAQYDLDYDQSLSILNDLRILLRTVAVVVRGTGY